MNVQSAQTYFQSAGWTLTDRGTLTPRWRLEIAQHTEQGTQASTRFHYAKLDQVWKFWELYARHVFAADAKVRHLMAAYQAGDEETRAAIEAWSSGADVAVYATEHTLDLWRAVETLGGGLDSGWPEDWRTWMTQILAADGVALAHDGRVAFCGRLKAMRATD